MTTTINRREATSLYDSLKGGVAPRVGLRHIAVGRQAEVNAFLHSLSVVEEGGAAFRFVCAPFGSGKSFLLQLIRNNAMERSFAVMDADLSPERRLTGTKGQGLATYRELMQHVSTRARPEGGALESILQKWIAGMQSTIARENNLRANDSALIEMVSEHIAEVLSELSEMAYGFAFSRVIDAYWRGMKAGDDALRQAALRWLRGEYTTKTEAKRELPVDCIIDDQSWYDFLKLFALFVCRAGYKGLLVFIDEGVNLYKITQKQARDSNYEKILTIYNDTMQGKAHHIGVFMSGTPQFIYDERRGLFNYEALRTRLADNRFSSEKYVDYNGPVIKLGQMTTEEIYLLLERLCMLHGARFSYECMLSQEDLTAFLNLVYSTLGADRFLKPRYVTIDFLALLDILMQNPGATVKELIADQGFQLRTDEKDPEQIDDESERLFAEFDI